MFYAAVNYEASKADEVSFVRGEKIEVLKKSLLGWWTVRLAHYVVLDINSNNITTGYCFL